MYPKSSIRFRWDILLLLFSVRDSIPSNNSICKKEQNRKKKKNFYLKRNFTDILGNTERESQSNIYCLAFPKMIYKGAFIIVVSFLFEIYYICKKNVPLQFHGMDPLGLFYVRSVAPACFKKKKKMELSSLTKSVVNWWKFAWNWWYI